MLHVLHNIGGGGGELAHLLTLQRALN